MKVLRYILAAFVGILVWPAVAIILGMLLTLVIPPREGQFFAGVWLDWHAVPGLVIGLATGVLVFRRIVKPRPKIGAKHHET